MERKLSKKMPPNTSRPSSRPPLTSRIRASFEGKHKSEVTSPTRETNGFITQDPQALRSAIDDAINSEAFQTAIAANLAKILKPSIKSALDTIQQGISGIKFPIPDCLMSIRTTQLLPRHRMQLSVYS